MKQFCRTIYKDLNLFSPCSRSVAAINHGIKVRPFDSIPGPKSLPVIGTLWKYLPLIGEYKFDRLHHNGLRKLKQYGSLVREDIVPGVPVVWVFKPEDIETVYRSEGRFPERRSHLALQKYRLDRPHIYSSGGLLPTNGPEWWRLRSAFQRSLSHIQNIRSFLPETDQVICEFISTCIKLGKTRDFLPFLCRLYLELTCLVAFDERLHSFTNAELHKDSKSSRLIAATQMINSCVLRTDNGPQLWRKFPTPLYRKLEKAVKDLEDVAVQLVSAKQEQVLKKTSSSDRIPSLLEQFLTTPELDTRDIVGMAADMLLAGIDTTTYTTSFALYHLATNTECQEKLYSEACCLLNRRYTITSQDFNQATYTKAVIKETFRMNPVSVGVGRILAKNAVLSGYVVPSGTVVVTQNQVSCRLEQYFPQANSFLPERWIKGSPYYQTCSPYLVLPFGHGPRTCIARRLAEQNLVTFLLRVVHKHRIKWEGGVLDCKSLLINKPDQPVSLSFLPR